NRGPETGFLGQSAFPHLRVGSLHLSNHRDRAKTHRRGAESRRKSKYWRGVQMRECASAETHALSDCTCELWHPVVSAGTSQEAREMRRREFYAIESKAQQPEQQQF